MQSSDSPYGTVPFPPDKIEDKFYQLEFSTSAERSKIIGEIASMIPWQVRVCEVADELKDPTLRVFARGVAPEVHSERITLRYVALAEKGHPNHYDDLEEGVFLLSSVIEPELSYPEFRTYLDRIALRVEELVDLNEDLASDDVKVHFLTRVLSQEEGFVGNHDEYEDPDNSFLHRVFIKKRGIPISLSVIYLLVAHRLRLPLYGVNMPLHFLLHFESNDYETYIDPYHGGVMLDRSTCIRFLKANGFQAHDRYFTHASSLTILKRMFRNLIHIYRKKENREMEKILSRHLLALDSKWKP
ncbi:transglutaminase-like protein [Leptospira broomii serovar Hurstbridge str. 5399]|uniref:Transglutaminase-like protein n=1 Tax=Leptospira broomii serovar Hurstbridge str. 5399 TaxID=1049789 RepID=T0FE92_9LEPT|nr:transglutaminase-like domain-containing protein [Leptospira broomii]EQA46181.1 transglutaminase-like protein [Leptospira broomii serovar Hurstbridge str. 5399]